MSLAEELLKTRSINELKTLVQQLQDDGEAKQTELQGMVGSQYLEFIQSADKILDMTHRSSCIVNNLTDFWKCNTSLTNQLDQLMRLTADSVLKKQKKLNFFDDNGTFFLFYFIF
jgi:uncharacterized protein Yka (UPF0111/DUF47 family)